MKPIELDNKKLYDLLKQKEELVEEGIQITNQIEAKEKIVKKLQDKEKMITGGVKPDPVLKAEGDALAKTFEDALKRLEEIGKAIEAKKMEAIPQEMLDEHKGHLKEIEKMERERNKLALKIQKIKDKVIPMVQKEVKPLLSDHYDDINTAKIVKDKVVITFFNHLEDWKRKFVKR